MNQRELLSAGLAHLDLGHSLLPVAMNKRPHVEALIATGHSRLSPEKKVKGSWLPLQETRPDEAMLRTWLGFGNCRLGLVTGAISGVVIIDGDLGDGIEKFDRWGVTPRCHVRTMSGGLHYYVQHPGWKVKTIQTHTGAAADAIHGVDIRGDGGYAVIAPTVIGARRYEALRSVAEIDDPSWMPREILSIMSLLDAPPAQSERRPVQLPCAQTQSSTQTNAAFEPLPAGQRWRAKDGTPIEEEVLKRACARADAGDSREGVGFDLAKQLRDNRLSYGESWEVMRRYVQATPPYNTKGAQVPYTLSQAQTSLEQAFSRAPRAAWGKLVRKDPPTLAARLSDIWTRLTPDEAALACVYACGMRGLARAQVRAALVGLRGWNEETEQVVELQKQAGQGVPGTGALVRLIEAAERRQP